MRRPWHFWPVAIPAFLWHLAAAADYLLTAYRETFYLSLWSPDLVDFVLGLPARITAAWALGVWAGLLGTLMMIRNIRGAAAVLAVAAAASVFFMLWLTVLAWPPFRSVAGLAGDGVLILAAAVPTFIWLYARTLHTRGVLA